MNTEPVKSNIRERHRRFENDIWDNRSICNNCFSRIRHLMSVDVDEYGTLVQNGIPEEVSFPTENTDRGHDAIEAEASCVPIHVPRIVCGECGSVGGKSEPDTISQRRAIELSERLASRLEEEGYEVDLDTLKDVVGQVKCHQNLQGFDREAFGLATKHSTLLPESEAEEL